MCCWLLFYHSLLLLLHISTSTRTAPAVSLPGSITPCGIPSAVPSGPRFIPGCNSRPSYCTESCCCYVVVCHSMTCVVTFPRGLERWRRYWSGGLLWWPCATRIILRIVLVLQCGVYRASWGHCWVVVQQIQQQQKRIRISRVYWPLVAWRLFRPI